MRDVLWYLPTLAMRLSVLEEGAWHVLRVEGLVVGRGLWGWGWSGRLVGLVLVLLVVVVLWVLWVLLMLLLLLLLLRAVLIYPALGRIAALGAYPAKWGPIVLFLVRRRHKLLLRLLQLLLVLDVLGRHLGRLVVVFLEEGVEVVLVLLVGGGQVGRRALVVLMPLLRTTVFLRLVLLHTGVALPGGLASTQAVLLCFGLLVLVALDSGCNATAQRLLLGLGHVCRGRGLGLIGAAVRRLESRCGRRPSLLLVVLHRRRRR